MSTRLGSAQPRIAALRQRADAEYRFAARAAEAASRQQTLAAAAASSQARSAHSAAAALHHDAEKLHLMAAAMARSQEARIVRWLGDPDPVAVRPRLIGVAAAMLGTPSASVTIQSPGVPMGRLSGSDPAGQAACEAEAVAGGGPGTDAWTRGRLRAAAGPQIAAFWPLYAQAVTRLGVRAVVAAPLGPPAGRVGAVCAYYYAPALAEDAEERTFRVAAALARLLLHEPGDLAPLLANDQDFAVIHQAAGMISVQAGCSISDAQHLLAARAYADGMPLAHTAAAVIRGQARF
jgi:hypothetical protein